MSFMPFQIIDNSLFDNLYRLTTKKTSELHITGPL